ncbi:EscU/YscU/HrcU family type III secretion system export apparatus switch protein [Pseudogracilibacillus sp. SO30301A]|uniref:EscU/YscU/HrcU family type III secretion system export apparatus switch protein n=1 Tax=Pseudogracilibacillus sp. SO30301A TaxID=3098291 RepID=UPI00300DD11F
MKEKDKKATTLSYEQNIDTSPKVTAQGEGLIADHIIEKAKENNVPILEDASLVELLSDFNIYEAIPTELYEAVAEVFAFVYNLDQEVENNKKNESSKIIIAYSLFNFIFFITIRMQSIFKNGGI